MTENTSATATSDEDDSPPAPRHEEVHKEESSEQSNNVVQPLAEKKAEYVPPNGGYGWVCVGCAFWINANTWGINSVRPTLDARTVN